MNGQNTVVSASVIKGLAIMLVAGLVLSSGGPIIRQIESASGFQIVFWRSIAQSVVVLIFLLLRDRQHTVNLFINIGSRGVFASTFLGLAFFGYVFSITNTTVANTMFLISTVPLFTALLAWPLLKERVNSTTWLAILIASAGVLVMVSQALAVGKLFGNAMGILCAVATALYVICIRWGAIGGRQIDMVPVVCFAGIVAALIALIIEGGNIAVTNNDLMWCIAAGACQNGPGFVLYTMAARHLQAAELSLLGLVEVIIGPIWVWLLFAEMPEFYTLIGGTLVLGAVIALAIRSISTHRR
ncbi:MAG: drug/metabolite transporter (DMT)-like permease [Planctomycetota bacterium]|jgi:drug/metabolite transporter (DMT)-like permease